MSNKKDLFYLNKVYPEADKIFSETYKPISELISDAVIVLDTNVLLNPFDATESSLNDIQKIFLNYKKENRLFIPSRVAQEFANNRAVKIGSVFLQIRQLKEKLNTGTYKLNKYPILENIEEYTKLINELDKVKLAFKESKKLIESLESKIQNWAWNDNVSKIYKEIFTSDIIIELKKSEEELEKDLEFRINYKIAPGFKDSGKPDDGIGDLIIWHTLIEISQKLNKDLVFVSNDQKNDWFYKQDKIGLYPKFELFDEFRRLSNGKNIAIIDFVKFLEFSNAKQETITEIKTSLNEAFSDFQTNNPYLLENLQIEHPRFGKGQIMKIIDKDDDQSLEVSFNDFGYKSLSKKYAPLKVLNTGWNFLVQNPNFDGDPRTYQLINLDDELDDEN